MPAIVASSSPTTIKRNVYICEVEINDWWGGEGNGNND